MICKQFISQSGCTKERCPEIHDRSLYPCVSLFSIGVCENQSTCQFSHEPLRSEKDIDEFIRDNQDFLLSVFKTRRETALGYFFVKYLHKLRETNRAKFESLGVQLPIHMPPYISPRMLVSKNNYQQANPSYFNQTAQRGGIPTQAGQIGYYQNVRGPQPNPRIPVQQKHGLVNSLKKKGKRVVDNRSFSAQKFQRNGQSQIPVLHSYSSLAMNVQNPVAQQGGNMRLRSQQLAQMNRAGYMQGIPALNQQGHPPQQHSQGYQNYVYGQQNQQQQRLRRHQSMSGNKQNAQNQQRMIYDKNFIPKNQAGVPIGHQAALINSLRQPNGQLLTQMPNQNMLLTQLERQQIKQRGLAGDALMGLSDLEYNSSRGLGQRGSKNRIKKIFNKLKISRKRNSIKEQKGALNNLMEKMRNLVFDPKNAFSGQIGPQGSDPQPGIGPGAYK